MGQVLLPLGLTAVARVPFLSALALAAALAAVAASGCRQDSAAMKKANLGLAFADRGDYERAIQTYQEALRLDPELVLTYEQLAQAYEATGRYPEAVQAYRTTVAKDPVRDDAYARLGCLLLATEGAVPEAEEALRSALALNQTHSGAHACLGAVHLDREELPAAIRESERAVSLNPQNVQGHLTLGIALAQTGDVARARVEIQKTIDLAAGNEAVAERARLYLQSLEHPPVEGGPAGAPPH